MNTKLSVYWNFLHLKSLTRLVQVAFIVFATWDGAIGLAQNAAPRGEPDPSAPWPEAERKGLWRGKQQKPELTPASASTESKQGTSNNEVGLLTSPKTTKHEVSVAGDFMFGQGSVTLPLGFSLAEVQGLGAIVPNVAKPDRESTYYGATVSYSFGQAWYFDFGYIKGSSSGQADVLLSASPDDPLLPSDFTIDDEWYQAYVRYTFPKLRGKRLSAYLRAGASFVQATMEDSTVVPALGLYHQTDETQDILGNLGFGATYSVYSSRRLKVGLQVEGEGFYGTRSQESLERLPEAGPSFPFSTVTIDNTLYGGIGRGTAHVECRLGKTGLFKVFLDGGMQVKYTQVEYPGKGPFSGGSFDELLWGPYAKLGVRYAF